MVITGGWWVKLLPLGLTPGPIHPIRHYPWHHFPSGASLEMVLEKVAKFTKCHHMFPGQHLVILGTFSRAISKEVPDEK